MLVVALVWTTAACGEPQGSSKGPLPSDGPTSGPTESTTSESSPSRTADEGAALEQYLGYYNAIYTLAQPTDDQVRAAFAPYAVPEAVEHWVQVFQGFADADKKPQGSIEFGPIDVTVSDATANVVECRDSTSEEMVSISTGELVAKGRPGTKIESKLGKDPNGTWLVYESEPRKSAC